MAYGQIRTSGGRTLNLSPQGWINNEGENLNAAPGNALYSAMQDQSMPQQNRLAQLAQQPSLSDFLESQGTSMKNRVDYNGKQAFMAPDGSVVWQNPDGSAGKATIRNPAQDAFEKQQLAMDTARANLEQTRAQTAAMNQPKQATTPAGYRLTQSGDLEAIPGGPADMKQQGRFNQDTASLTATESAMNDLAAQANAIKGHKGLDAATGWQTLFPTMPGSDAANAQAQLDTLKSKTAFGTLQAMRDASKTGGALGAVSEKELKLLESNLAALDTAQSPEQFRQSLDAIIKYAEAAKGRSRGAYNLTHSDNRQAQQPATSTPSASGTSGFDSAKEARYQAWKKAQGR